MFLFHWLRSWRTVKPRWTIRQLIRRSSRPLPAEIQLLEERLLLTNYVVTSLDDVPETGPVTADGQVSLREAIRAANTNTQVGDAAAGEVGGIGGATDTITFASSLQGSTLNIPNGVLGITDDLTITGLGSSQFAIDAQSETGIFDVSGSITVSISGLTLASGFASFGGAIYNQDADLTLTEVVIRDSEAFGGEGGGGRGGGLFNEVGQVTILDSMITNNSADFGGAVSNSAGSVRIQQSTISNNNGGFDGGGIYNAGSLQVRNSTLSGNSSFADGGGIYNTGNVMVTNSTLSGNFASGFGGGIDNEGNLTTVNDTVVANWAANHESVIAGDGNDFLFGGNGNDLTFGDATIGDMLAAGDGGMGNDSLTLVDPNEASEDETPAGEDADYLIFGEGNDSLNAGAGQDLVTAADGNDTLSAGDGGDPVVAADANDTLIAGDGAGGGIWTGGSTTLGNTIVAGNVQGANRTPDDLGGQFVNPESGYNLIGDPSSSGGLAEGDNGNRVGDGAGGLLPLDQIVDPTLQNNGGPTETHQLVLTGRAVDAGSNTLAVNPGPDGVAGTSDDVPLATDQRGFPRVVDVAGIPNATGGVDIGAVEYEPTAFDIFPLDAFQLEGNAGVTNFTFVVYRSDSVGATSVDYFVTGITADANDFAPGTPLSGTVQFADGEYQQIITLGVEGDFQLERNETFTVNLTNPAQGTTINTASATGEILNDETIEVFGAGSGTGTESMPPQVIVKNAATGEVLHNFYAYDFNFRGGVRVAAADVNGDGAPDVITGAGPGGGPHVKVFDGLTGQTIASYFAYSANFTGGVFVAAGDVNGDGHADIITGAGAGGGPHVKVFDGQTLQTLRSFFAYAAGFSGGVTVASGDVNYDGYSDVVTGAGPGGGPHLKVFDGSNGQTIASFFAYNPGFTGGVTVAAGDVNGDGYADIITGAGAGGGPHVKVFDGSTLQTLASFFAFDANLTTGIFVGLADTNSDGLPEILVGPGRGSQSFVRVFNTSGGLIESSTFIFNPHFRSGVHVGGSTVSQFSSFPTEPADVGFIPNDASSQSGLDLPLGQVFNQSLLEQL